MVRLTGSGCGLERTRAGGVTVRRGLREARQAPALPSALVTHSWHRAHGTR